MLLLIALTLVDFASSLRTEQICVGNSYDFPIYYTPPLFEESVYYKPSNRPRIRVVSNGKSIHKRFQVGIGGTRMKDLTEEDDGAKLFFGDRDSVTLEVSDCQEPETYNYGDLFSWRVPYGADYLEFTEISPEGDLQRPYVMWNRTNPSAGRGTVRRSYYEFSNLNQKDNGYYRFKGANGDTVKWKRVKVQEYSRQYEYLEGESLSLSFPLKFPSLRGIVFIPQGEIDEDSRFFDRNYLDHRMELTEYHFFFYNLKKEDSGTYRFEDNKGQLALQMELEVNYRLAPTWAYVVGLIIIVLCLVCCCCCVRKCCCKKSSNKRNSPATGAAAPPVYHHDTTQHTQPVVPLLHREPRVIAANPPAYNAVTDHTGSPQPTQVTVPEGQGQTSTSGVLASSDFDPRFEFKGSAFPSAPPLSSGTSIQDVYTSDKLNFL